MHEIRFKANPGHEPKHDLDLVKRIACIVTGTNRVEERAANQGYRWQLGESNDWKMDKDPQTGEFILAYRYGGGRNGARMKELRQVIIWLIGLDLFNEE